MTKNENLTIQQKIATLDELAAWFEGDDFVLEEAIERFKAATALADTIKHDLEKIGNDITVLETSFDTP